MEQRQSLVILRGDIYYLKKNNIASEIMGSRMRTEGQEENSARKL